MSARPIGPQVRIRELRSAYGLSVKQLIERIGEEGGPNVHEDHIRNVELGHKKASGPLMTAWAKALRLNPLDVWQESRDLDTIVDTSSSEEGMQ